MMALVATVLPGQLETPSSAWRGTYFAFIFNFLKHKSKQGPFDLTFTCYTLGFPGLENQQMIIFFDFRKNTRCTLFPLNQSVLWD